MICSYITYIMSSERKIHSYESIILTDMTLDKEGFDPRLVGYQKKHIWAICRFCGEPHRLLGANYKKSGSACHKACRLQEQSESPSPFSDPKIREKAQKNRTKDVSIEEIGQRISKGRKKAQPQIEQTCLDKYGVANPFQAEEVKEKIKATNRERYGVEHPMKDPARVEQAKRVFQETISDDERYYLKQVLGKDEFWKDLGCSSFNLQKIADKYDIKYSSLTATLVKDEYRQRYYDTYTFPKYQCQKDVLESLGDHGLNVDMNTRQVIKPLELDLYFPDVNFAIEFNGSYWHSEAFLDADKARRKQFNKTKQCEMKSIRLFHIFEHDWYERRTQISGFLKSTLGLNERTVYARKCEIDGSEQRTFHDDNHIQGYGRGTIKYFNLIHEGEMVASMTAARHHRQNASRSEIVLNRLCFLNGMTVVGGASKLFKRFKAWAKDEGYDNIVSWSDNAWTQGGIYSTLGFDLDNEYGPDYFYWDERGKGYKSKQSQQKSATGCPKDITERDWCFAQRLFRIWDCGKKRWIYSI